MSRSTRPDPVGTAAGRSAPSGPAAVGPVAAGRTAPDPALLSLFRPRSIAVVGASRRQDSVGHAVLRNLVLGGFTGPVFAINTQADVVLSMPCHRSVASLPQQVDLAILVVPAAAILEAVEDCRRNGVRAIIVLSAGFAETGEPGRLLQEQLTEAVRAAGMRMVGPNCLGLLNTDPATRLNATFALTTVRSGRVAMSSQSGALALVILEYAREFGLGFSSFVSIGNRADVSSNDLLEYWEHDPQTDLVLLYAETFGNPRHFSRLARRIARRKPILAVKSGRSLPGQRAASSHTAALAGSEAGTEALLRQAGVLRMDTLEQMFEVASLLAHQALPRGSRVAIVTNAGGPGILCTDACAGEGLQLKELSPATQAALRTFLPPAASVVNPVDMIATCGAPAYARAIPLLLDDPDVDALIAIHIPVRRQEAFEVAAAVRAGRAAATSGRSKPLLTCMLSEAWQGAVGSIDAHEMAGVAEAAGACSPADASRARAATDAAATDVGMPAGRSGHEVIPNFRFPESAARALGAACRHAAWLAKPEGVVPEFADLDVDRARAVCRAALGERGEGWLRPQEVTDVLAAFGVHVVPTLLCRSAEQAVQAAGRLGYPVVVKLASDTLVHKSEWKGVHLDLRDERAVRGAWDAIRAALAAAGRAAEMLGVTVQPLAARGVETMIGLTRDPSFGPLVAFGLGGTAVEVFGDVVFRITPLTDLDAQEMLASIRGRKLLLGDRGAEPVDREALAQVLLRVARLAELVPEVAELDLNPVRALPEGRGVAVLDARVLVRRP